MGMKCKFQNYKVQNHTFPIYFRLIAKNRHFEPYQLNFSLQSNSVITITLITNKIFLYFWFQMNLYYMIPHGCNESQL
jgi:hypothetical protein